MSYRPARHLRPSQRQSRRPTFACHSGSLRVLLLALATQVYLQNRIPVLHAGRVDGKPERRLRYNDRIAVRKVVVPVFHGLYGARFTKTARAGFLSKSPAADPPYRRKPLPFNTRNEINEKICHRFGHYQESAKNWPRMPV